MRPTAPLAIAAVLLLVLAPPARAAQHGRTAEADSLCARAEQMLRRNTIETRRIAIACLEQATLLRPGDANAELMLARVYYQSGFLKRARQRFERAARMSPQDAAARFGLGQVWRRDWLKYLETRSLDLAVQNFSAAARLSPQSPEAWLMLTPLLVEQENLRAAAAAAERALEAAPDRPECELAVAYTSYRRGGLERAEQGFRRAIPLLPRTARERFDDIAPVATEEDTVTLHRLAPDQQAAFVRRFWSEHDPDPTSPENEAQLEYWSRVTHAYFLYYNARRREWDERGEVYVRYGAPQRAEYNPLGTPLTTGLGTFGAMPMNVLVWEYPELGMAVEMQDRMLSEYYLLPIARAYDPDPRPDPDSLARHGDAFASAGGRGVFPVLPPGVKPIPVDGRVARFEGPGGTRVLAQVEVAGTPGEALVAEWAVFDSLGVERARAQRSLTPSACDPAVRRVAEFAADLPPGRYRVGLSVRGGARRGVIRRQVDLPVPDGALALSDIVISCGAPDLLTGAPVRIAPNPGAHVPAGQPLTAYFEAYRLQPGADQQSRFEYVYSVRSAARDERVWIQRAFAPRPVPAPIEASREEAFVGDVRRQFVSVPVQGLPAGRYRLEVQVRDLVSGAVAKGRAEFTRDEPTALGR